MTTIDVLQSSLRELGYDFHFIQLGQPSKAFVEIRKDGQPGSMILSTSSPLYPFSTASTRLICRDKSMSYDLAVQNGVRIPRSVYVSASETLFDDAYALLDVCGKIVVKPTASSLSKGVTLDIDNKESLGSAIRAARVHSDDVVVQEQVCGDEIRFAVIDGVVKAAILRQTARVVGDGKLTLRALIDAENQSRQIVTDTAVAYPMLDATLIRTGDLDLASVPDHGVVVELAKGTMIRSGASMYNVMDDIHSTYIDMVNDFASKLGRGFVVADMMLQDYTQPMNDDNYAFIEFNITPALQLFYSCRDGKHFRIGEQYLAPMIDKVMQGSYL